MHESLRRKINKFCIVWALFILKYMIDCKFKSPSTNNIKNSNTGNKQEVIMTELQCWWVLSEGAIRVLSSSTPKLTPVEGQVSKMPPAQPAWGGSTQLYIRAGPSHFEHRKKQEIAADSRQQSSPGRPCSSHARTSLRILIWSKYTLSEHFYTVTCQHIRPEPIICGWPGT